MRYLAMTCVALLLALVPGQADPAASPVPRLVNYQGLLADHDSGEPLQGTHSLTFRIYDSPEPAAPPLWEEAHVGVEIAEGIFNVILGGTTPLTDALFGGAGGGWGGDRWLGTAVDGEEELVPRLRLTAVPWALRSAVADSVAGGGSGPDGDWTIVGSDMHATVTGNVGVGTDSPTRKLDVQGGSVAVRRGADPLQFLHFDSDNAIANTISGNSREANKKPLFIQSYHDGSGAPGGESWMRFSVGGSAAPVHAVNIRENGNVGIGTFDALHKLDVAGTTRTQGFEMPTGAEAGWVLTTDAAGVGTWQPGGGGGTDNDWTVAWPHMYAAVPGSLGIGTTILRGRVSIRNETGIGLWSTVGEGAGIYGSGTTYGVQGSGRSNDDSHGVYGSHAGSGNIGYLGSHDVGAYGEYGYSGNHGSLGAADSGAYGQYLNGNFGYLGGAAHGVYGELAGNGNHGALGASSSGVRGDAAASGSSGVEGFNVHGGIAVRGYTAGGDGVVGINSGSGDSGYLARNDCGVFGLGTSDPGVKGQSGLGHGVYGLSTSGAGVYGHSTSGAGVYGASDDGYAGRFDGTLLVENGRITTPVIEITGGSDLSEQFGIRGTGDAAEPGPGMVVCIDPARPGGLVVSAQAYDKRVAGVISGAGGVAPGLLMGQRGTVADGEDPVALTGRVYCLADATEGPIEPGDLLTTSQVPGHAMRAVDPARTPGAVIGKAMTGLAAGRGLVLVLVSLQ